MKNLLLFTLLALLAVIIGCSPKVEQTAVPVAVKAAEPRIEGIWRYDGTFVGVLGNAVDERIDIKLSAAGKADFKMRRNGSIADSIEGDWKRSDDMLILTKPDSSFETFRVVAVEQAELRLLSQSGKLYRLTRMP